MSTILLCTLNARFIHASLGLRYLYANLGASQADAEIREFIVNQRPAEIVEAILLREPRIVGFGVYIWNVEETTKVVAMLKSVRPEIVVVLGGPEVSYEYDEQRIVALADYVITGWGEASLRELVEAIVDDRRPTERIITGKQLPLTDLALPYRFYSDVDIEQRLIYVEASRGCPFKCEFCLSSLDRTAWPFDLDGFLAEMSVLYDRGARHFKFVDRTFNLNIKSSLRILQFFLDRMDDRLFVHFEVIPDHLPDALKTAIAKFPAGRLQFEVGVQSWDPTVQSRISRKQDNEKTSANLAWLRQHSGAHIHADLIAGLPGEDLETFGRGFDRLVSLRPHEIQVGILKRLRGTPIARHTQAFGVRYNPDPPYNILASDQLDFATVQRLQRFARYWDLVGNSGRFVHTVPLLLGDAPFERFMRFADWLYARNGQTHAIALDRLFELVFESATRLEFMEEDVARDALSRDYAESGARGAPSFLAAARTRSSESPSRPARAAASARQSRHAR